MAESRDCALVSIVIPFDEQSKFIEQAIDSVKMQTWKEVELVIVDNRSAEHEAELVVGKGSATQITVVRQPNRQGIAGALNTGISYARGEFILPLGPGDTILPMYLELTLSELQKAPNIVGVYTDVRCPDAGELIWKPDVSVPAVLCEGAPPGFLYRRAVHTILGGYRDVPHRGEMPDFWLRLLERKLPVSHLDEPLYVLRRGRERSVHHGKLGADRLRALIDANEQICRLYLTEIMAYQAERFGRAKEAQRLLEQRGSQLYSTAARQQGQLEQFFRSAPNAQAVSAYE